MKDIQEDHDMRETIYLLLFLLFCVTVVACRFYMAYRNTKYEKDREKRSYEEYCRIWEECHTHMI